MADGGLAVYLARSRDRLSDEPERECEGEECPEDMQAAAEDILAALGQDYGNSPSSSEGQRMEFQDKAKRLARAMHAFFVISESKPHPEGEHT